MTVEVKPVYYGGKWSVVPKEHRATCPRHGTWVFPPESVELPVFVVAHESCVAVPVELQRRRRHRKSRRSALPAGLAPFLAPSPILLELGQPVKMEAPPDASWVTFGKPGGSA